MKKITIMAAIVFWFVTEPLCAQEKIVIGGSGALAQEMQDLAKAYMAKNPSDVVEVRAESMSTSGGIEGVKSEQFAIGLITRKLEDHEKGKLAYRAMGRTPSGVAVHKSLPISNLNESQVCDIFSGRIKSWKEVGGSDGKITVLTRKTDDNGTQAMREKIACFRDLKISPEAIVLIRGSEVLDALNHRPGLVGVVNVGSGLKDREHVKAVAINGADATPDALQSGKYKYYQELGVVTLGEPKGLTKRFLDFVSTTEGQKILALRGMIPVR